MRQLKHLEMVVGRFIAHTRLQVFVHNY